MDWSAYAVAYALMHMWPRLQTLGIPILTILKDNFCPIKQQSVPIGRALERMEVEGDGTAVSSESTTAVDEL